MLNVKRSSNENALKGNREALKSDRRALTVDEEALKGNEKTLKDNEEALNGDEEPLQCDRVRHEVAERHYGLWRGVIGRRGTNGRAMERR